MADINLKKWYVVRAVSGQENKVKAYIETEINRLGMSDYISQVLVPTEKVVQVRDGKKIKEIIGYFEDEDENEDTEIIAYISWDDDIEDDYDLLDDFFYNEVREKYEELVKNGVIEEWDDEDEE